ncbi:hypothetical protein SAMN05444373_106111 [Thermoclostridium caenicola]|uniref:Cell-wall binding lipoprotein n=2 Tax=Thermoclostridium caenicola TaxID=659425 RepID=A0A1M6JS71_9FIRM|nr:hypothetical protein SAMN05444373_106111 [Thermoclostridium caenicola]
MNGMRKAAAIIASIGICLVLASCGEEPNTGISAEIEGYKAQIASLEETVIKLKEEIAVKDSLIEELRQDERFVRDQVSRKQETESYYGELEKAISFMSGRQAYTQQGPLNGSYSVDRGLQTLDKIKSALESFSDMTALVKEGGLLTEEELNAIGNTDETIQNVEFHNMIIRIKGQMLEQNYIIKALDLRRALVLYELGRAERKELDARYEAFLNAREQYQKFVNSAFYRDIELYSAPFQY